MLLENICTPALIYIIFSLIQIVMDTSKGLYNTAFMKFWVAIIFTFLLNFLCERGLGTVSWIIVFIPFILMTFVVAVLLLIFGLNPSTGKIEKSPEELKAEEEELQKKINENDPRVKSADDVAIQEAEQNVIDNIKQNEPPNNPPGETSATTATGETSATTTTGETSATTTTGETSATTATGETATTNESFDIMNSKVNYNPSDINSKTTLL